MTPITAVRSTTGDLSTNFIENCRREVSLDDRARLAMNAVTKTSIKQVALNRDVVNKVTHTYSHQLKAGEATSQNSSGRCWMFAALNTFRTIAMESMNLDAKFELSQNYPLFWDKLEKANYFLESILQTLDEPTDGRLIAYLLRDPIQDGGQWDMFVNILKKYGAVPKTAMPETESSSATGAMTSLITTKLREFACTLRESGWPMERMREEKERMMREVYRMLVIHLGEPPTEFDWQWRDKDEKFSRDGVITPLQFVEKHIPIDKIDDLVCLIHCPMSDKEFNKMYTVEYLGNVIGGHIIRYLNVDLPVIKKAALDQLMDDRAVWFGCDVGKGLDRDLGILDLGVLDYGLVYGTTFDMDKRQRLEYGHSAMNHAMVFTGVDVEDERPRKWRVENSWGEKAGEKGFLVMTDSWFDEYMYEVVVDKKHLPAGLLPILETEPIKLPPWDPMGALARSD
jgi:bleomycin hydrolase